MTTSDPRVQKLSTADKIALVSGMNFWEMQPIPALDYPAITLTDGPHGVRKQRSNTRSRPRQQPPCHLLPDRRSSRE